MKYFSLPGILFTAFLMTSGLQVFSQVTSSEILELASQKHDSGFYDVSIRLLSDITKSDPNYARACYEMALSFYYKGETDKAMQKCHEATFYKYDHPFVYSLTGSILDNMGRPLEGIALLKKALKKWSFNQNLLYNLGVCYLNAGYPDSCERVLTHAVILYPYHTRSHMGIAKANYAMGRMGEAYLAFNMAILITPNNLNIRDFENAIGGKSDIVPRAYKYPYDATQEHQKWDNLRYLMQSEFAFSKLFNYPYKMDFTFTRQSYMLFTNLVYEQADTSIYNRFYGRFFHELINKGYFEVYTNYCMKNIGSTVASEWDSQNPGKISSFIAWAQQFIDNGRMYAYRYDLEKQNVRIHHFTDGNLTSIGRQEGDDNIRNGLFIVISEDGAIAEKGTYVNDLTEGKWLLLYPDGVMKQDLNFVHDSLDGIIRTFYPNGSKTMEYTFSMGNKHGKTSEFYSSGKPHSEYYFTRNVLNGPGEFHNIREGFIRKYNYVNDTVEGVTSETWLNGNLKLSYSVLKGEFDGLYRQFFVNGKTESTTYFKHGIKNGAWANYHFNGMLKDTGSYDEMGNLSGALTSYDRYGKITYKATGYNSGKLSGCATDYFKNGKVQVTLCFTNDSLKQIESFDNTGKLLYSAQAKHDSLLYKAYYEDGIVKQEGLRINNKNQGIWKFYSPVGILLSEKYYHNGLQSGEQKSFYPNGALKEEYFCDSNYVIGLYKEYYMNGHVKSTRRFIKEGIDGEWISYYPNDSVSRISFYVKGTKAGRDILWHPDGHINVEEIYNDLGEPIGNNIYDQQENIEYQWDYAFGNHEFVTRYKSGKNRAVVHFSDGLKNGMHEEFYPNGQLKTQLNYVYGKPHGTYVKYDYKGNLESEYHYNMGLLEGEGKRYLDGKPDYFSWYENDINQGEIKDFHYNGMISRIMMTEDDELIGNTEYFSPEGTFMYRAKYLDGYLKAFSWKNSTGSFVAEMPVTSGAFEVTMYYQNGRPCARFSLNKGKYHGKQTTYYSTGSLLKESEFVYGESHGDVKIYYPGNKLFEKTSYQNDERNGPYIQYFTNGKIRYTGNYLNDERHGDWMVYNENGKEIEILRYYHGDLYEIVTQ